MPTRPRVIIVDDHPGVAKALHRALSTECDVVGVVTEGRQVAETAARLQPAIVVLDLNLADVNGLDVCRQITQGNPDTIVIVISAMADDTVRDEALAAGAAGFFHKSAAGELLLAITAMWTDSEGG